MAVIVAVIIGWILIRRRRKNWYSTNGAKGLHSEKNDGMPELPVQEKRSEMAEKIGPGSFQYEMEGDSPQPAELQAYSIGR